MTDSEFGGGYPCDCTCQADVRALLAVMEAIDGT